MTTQKLIDFFENNGFIVNTAKEDNILCAEIEKWTKGGVDMIIYLYPFSVKEFKSYVDDFDIDENIDLHRQGIDYRNAFSISEALDDFSHFHKHLKDIAKKLN